MGKACWELSKELPEQWLWIIEEIKTIVADLPANGGRQLLELYKQVPGKLTRDRERTAVDRLRHLLIRLSESWERYTIFFHDPGIPWTNNRTEQVIGRMKSVPELCVAIKLLQVCLMACWSPELSCSNFPGNHWEMVPVHSFLKIAYRLWDKNVNFFYSSYIWFLASLLSISFEVFVTDKPPYAVQRKAEGSIFPTLSIV